MTNEMLKQQAAAITKLLPQLMRQLFALDYENPAIELPIGQLRVCSILQLKGQLALTSLSKELSISMSAVTQIADRLEKSGIVERISSAGDKRIKHLQLTKYGKNLMNARLRKRVDRVSGILEVLSDDERNTITQSLKMLLDAAAKSKHVAQAENAAIDPAYIV